jgi:hypothetical protein
MDRVDDLPRVSPEALAAFKVNRQTIIDEVVERSMARKDEVRHHGARAKPTLATGLAFTSDMLETAMSLDEITLLDNALRWAIARLPHDGVMPEHILSRFRIYADVVAETLPSAHAEQINTFVNWMIERQQQLIAQADDQGA